MGYGGEGLPAELWTAGLAEYDGQGRLLSLSTH
jgi:hypothetical protein